jgi:tetratricopeptide (TPR) repeat protein
MSFDKAKAMRNAERFLAQGKIRAAINEYQRVIESDRTDFSTLNMLGDLYAKASEPDEAVACFTQVAEHYSKQGFSQKAIAIYNKISRLKPDSIEVSAKLAQLYQAKGSVAEARVHYTTLAEQYSRKGKKAEALNIWKQIAGLDPNNIDIYFKIADICWQDQQKDEAANAYIEAGKRLNAKAQYESAVTAFSRALEINPDHLPALKGFVESQVSLGYADEAAKSLESSIARQPHNRELMFLLIDCYIDMGNLFEAEKTVIKLVEQEPSNYPKLLDLVQAYLKNTDLESATRILSMASEHLLVGGKAQTLESVINEILIRNPEQLDAVRLLVRLHSWQRDETAIKRSFERLAEVAKLSNAVEDERYALQQLIMIAPQNAYFAQRLQELNIANGYPQGYYDNPLGRDEIAEDIPTFESYTTLTEEDESGLNAETMAVEYGGVLNYSNGNGHLNGYYDTDTQNIGTESIVEEEFPAASTADDEITVEKGNLSEFELHNLVKEIEGIDFYISQGFTDLAEKTLVELEERFGPHPEIEKTRRALNLNETAPAEVKDELPGEDKVETLADVADIIKDFEAVTNEFEPDVDTFQDDDSITIESDKLQTLDEFSGDGNESGFDRLAAAETQTIETALVEEIRERAELEESLETSFAFAPESAAELTVESLPAVDQLEDISEPETPSIPPVPVEVKKTPADLLDEFKAEFVPADSQIAENEDFDTCYQTGMAYKEMGLIEDAISEFQDAVKQVSADDGTRRFYWCCNLLGHCFLEKRMANIALMWFKRALETKNLSHEESQGLRYELASAYEMGGDKQSAIRYFEEIYAFDVGYRDVGQRLERLMTA